MDALSDTSGVNKPMCTLMHDPSLCFFNECVAIFVDLLFVKT
jgi:hypothetical protein